MFVHLLKHMPLRIVFIIIYYIFGYTYDMHSFGIRQIAVFLENLSVDRLHYKVD